jgi:hypothetical protein
MLDIYTLEEGVIYTVTKPFTDYYQGYVALDTKLTYVGRAFLPYHGGHTLFFKEQNIYLQEDEDAGIINSLHEHLTIFDAAGRVAPSNRQPVLTPRERRKGIPYFVGFFVLAVISLLILFFGPARPVWLPFVPFGIGFLLLIAAVIAGWRHPV